MELWQNTKTSTVHLDRQCHVLDGVEEGVLKPLDAPAADLAMAPLKHCGFCIGRLLIAAEECNVAPVDEWRQRQIYRGSQRHVHRDAGAPPRASDPVQVPAERLA